LPKVTKTRRPAKSTSRTKNPADASGDRLKRTAKVSAKAGKPARPAKLAKPASASARATRGTAKAAHKGGGVRSRPSEPAPSTRSASPQELDASRDLALAAIEAALEKKALMPILIDVSGMASYTDFIGIVSGRSDRQVEAIADAVGQFMKSQGRRVIGHEGSGNGRWTLLDYGEIVIHVFYHPVREFYDLESLWIDAPRVKMAIPPEAILTQPDALYGAL
jgi:ribosome-associated protein